MPKSLTVVARKLRRESTPHERRLWALLRRKNFQHLKFRRQYVIGKYIVDFCCPAKKLVIELDGGGHAEERQMQNDKARDAFLQSEGFKILRVWNNELKNNLEGVFEEIIALIK